ncbi:MAG: hypothetical protein MUC68_17650 [Burkholderiaceae bacterium]|nr:hypothetical protein [Burkholderiaceae bacterium]
MKRRFSGKASQHVGGEAGDHRRHHVAGGGGDRLRAVVLQDGEVLHQARAGQQPVQRERQDHRGQADADRDAGLGADVQRGGGQQTAEQEAGGRRAQRELRHVAAEHVLQPPAVFFFAAPVADLVVGELLQRHLVGDPERKGRASSQRCTHADAGAINPGASRRPCRPVCVRGASDPRRPQPISSARRAASSAASGAAPRGD